MDHKFHHKSEERLKWLCGDLSETNPPRTIQKVLIKQTETGVLNRNCPIRSKVVDSEESFTLNHLTYLLN
jgi:hypothetical protein